MVSIKQGEQLFAEGRTEEAERCFLEILNQDASNREVCNNLGVLAFEKGDMRQAQDYFFQALKIDPLYQDALHNLDAVIKSTIEEPAAQNTPAAGPCLTDHRIAIINTFDNKFTGIYASYFSKENEVQVVMPETEDDLLSAAEWADIVWCTWCNEPLVYLSRQSLRAALVTHIRSYEVLTPGLIKNVSWQNIDGAIFVADHIREIANRIWKAQLSPLPQTTVYNSVDLDRYPFYENGPGKNVCYVGYLNHKKGIGLLLQCIREAVTLDRSFKFHIAGDFQETRFEVYMKHLIHEMGLAEHVIFRGWVKDIPDFLKDMNYVISTSPWEGCPNNIIEAMACGIKPLIHNWKGAKELFPKDLVFSSLHDFTALLSASGYRPKEYRRHVEINFNASKRLPQIEAFLASVLAEKTPDKGASNLTSEPRPGRHAACSKPEKALQAQGPKGVWVFPDSAFARDPEERLEALVQEAKRQLASQRFETAETSLWRAATLSQFSDEPIIQALVQIYQMKDDVPAIQKIWKRAAVSALEDCRLDYFLHYSYLSIYAEHLFGKRPNYKYSFVDEDINAYVRLISRRHPLSSWIKRHRRRKKALVGDRLRVGFVLEGFSQRQASVRNYYPLAEHHDKGRFDCFFYSRWFMEEEIAREQGYHVTVDQLKKWGCHVRTPDKRLTPMEQVEFIVQAVVTDKIDILVFQTTYFVPQYNLVSCLHPARFQAALEAQQPEYSQEMDLIFTTKKQVPECRCQTAPWVISSTRKASSGVHERGEFGIPESAVVLISVNRHMRYHQKTFWDHMGQVLQRHPSVYFVAVGLTDVGDLLPERLSISKQVVTAGYRTDIMEFLGMADIYVDLFPSGAGSSIIEAMQAGLPIVCFEQDFSSPFSVQNVSLAPTFVKDDELVVPCGDTKRWHRVIDEMITDGSRRERIGKAMVEAAAEYEPKRVTVSFFETLENAFYEKEGTP